MKITYEINEKDFLIHQLYLSSQSMRIKKKRAKNRIIPALIYTLFGIICYIKTNNIFILLGFASLGILWFLIFPIWERKHYIRHYRSFIDENYQARFNLIVSLQFAEEHLFVQDHSGEAKILNHSILSIIELKELVLIQLGIGQNIILPKDKIDEIDKFTSYLKTWAKELNIEYQNKQNWKFE